MGPILERKVQRDPLTRGIIGSLGSPHLNQLKALFYSLFPQKWGDKDFEYFLVHPCKHSWGIFIGDELASFLLALLVREDLDVIALGTAASFQNQGYAKELLKMSMQDPKIKRIFLEVRDHNFAAIRLYQTLGFKTLTVRRKYYEGTTDALQLGWVKNGYLFSE